MPLTYTLQKLRDLTYATLLKKFVVNPRFSYTRDEIKIHQQERLKKVLAYSKKKSPFYQEQLKDIDPETAKIEDIPILTKKDLTERFDDVVTDPKLKWDQLNEYLNQLQTDEYHQGYKIFRSGGSSGNPTIMCYNWREFAAVQAQILRSAQGAVKWPFPRRIRAANIYARNPTHDSIRISQSFQVGAHYVQDLAVDMDVDEMISRLNEFQPDVLNGYPSLITELAHAKLDKKLQIAPQAVFLGSEPLSQQMRQDINRAFGFDPHDHYGTTEAIIMATECRDHACMHLQEDMHIIEVVDENNQPVRPGELGHKVLVTNLYAFTQPIIRYELTDMLLRDNHTQTVCSCGSSMTRIKRIVGRNEDVFHFLNTVGQKVSINPEELRQAMAKCQNVRQFQIVSGDNKLRVKAILDNKSIENHSRDQIIKVLSSLLQNLEIKIGQITCDFVSHLDRGQHPSQKFRQIYVEKN